MFTANIPFVSLHRQPGLVSLDAARSDPSIRYRSVDLMCPAPYPQAPPARPVSTVLKSSVPLIPLAVAQAKEEIKYRREGFEMQEHRRHILAVRLGEFF
jgi:hypothetical protein